MSFLYPFRSAGKFEDEGAASFDLKALPIAFRAITDRVWAKPLFVALFPFHLDLQNIGFRQAMHCHRQIKHEFISSNPVKWSASSLGLLAYS